MRTFKPHIMMVFLVAAALIFFQSCAGSKDSTSEKQPEKKLPGDLSVSPSSFQCEAIILSADSANTSLLVTKVLARGSSLFYPVADGDTITARFSFSEKTLIQQIARAEMLIQERLKMNSDKPDFIIQKIYPHNK